MSNKDSCNSWKIQLQIPNEDNHLESPALVVMDEAGNKKSLTIPLNDIFSQAEQSYQNAPEAMHRFSYYLLLQAKEFATSEQALPEAEVVNLHGGE